MKKSKLRVDRETIQVMPGSAMVRVIAGAGTVVANGDTIPETWSQKVACVKSQ